MVGPLAELRLRRGQPSGLDRRGGKVQTKKRGDKCSFQEAIFL